MSDCNLYYLMWWQEAMVQPREWCCHSSSLPSTPLTSNTTPANVTSRGGQSGMYFLRRLRSFNGCNRLLTIVYKWRSLFYFILCSHLYSFIHVFWPGDVISRCQRNTWHWVLKVFSTCQESCQELKSSAEEASAVNRKIYRSKKTNKHTQTHNINTLKQWDLASLFDICHSNLAVFMLSGEQEVANR